MMRTFKNMASTSRAFQQEIPAISKKIDVLYSCPSLGAEVLPKTEWMKKIRSHLLENFKGNEILASCRMIKSLNEESAVSECVKTLETYLKNIKENPEDEKYKKIRLKNKIYLEKVNKVEGAFEFLVASGFVFNIEEDYLVFEKGNLDLSLETLVSSSAIQLVIYRDLKVFKPQTSNNEFPDDFYEYSLASIRKEHERREKKAKLDSQLRTKAMRMEQKEAKNYSFTIIRVRFPDGLFLQGTFEVTEPFCNVKNFVSDSLAVQTQFDFYAPCGESLDQKDYQKTLLTLNLVPAVILNIRFKELFKNDSFLKADLMNNIKNL